MHLAIRALARARAQNVDATLTIVGGGQARRDLEKLARELGISDHVIWRGEVSRQELLGTYGAYHAFLFPSLHDAGGTVILEALGARLTSYLPRPWRPRQNGRFYLRSRRSSSQL